MEPITETITDAASAAGDIKAKLTTSWRDLIKVHPAADAFPMMDEPELRALGEDILKTGVQVPVITCDGKLLDGRNRLSAMELVGITFKADKRESLGFRAIAPDGKPMALGSQTPGAYTGKICDPYEFVVSANIHRRNLTADKKREVIAKLLKENPERSDRATADIAKTSPQTVTKVRKGLEATAQIEQLDKRTGKDGKARSQRVKKSTTATATIEPKRAVEEPKAPEQPKVVTSDDLRTWIYLKPALPMSELFTALWDCCTGAERLDVYQLVISDEWRTSRPRVIDRQPQQTTRTSKDPDGVARSC